MSHQDLGHRWEFILGALCEILISHCFAGVDDAVLRNEPLDLDCTLGRNPVTPAPANDEANSTDDGSQQRGCQALASAPLGYGWLLSLGLLLRRQCRIRASAVLPPAPCAESHR